MVLYLYCLASFVKETSCSRGHPAACVFVVIGLYSGRERVPSVTVYLVPRRVCKAVERATVGFSLSVRTELDCHWADCH